MDVRCIQFGCEEVFNNNDDMNAHWISEHDKFVGKVFGCGGCKDTFKSRGLLKQHRIKKHPELQAFQPVKLDAEDHGPIIMSCACPICEMKFRYFHTCLYHIKVEHLGWRQRKLFDCTDCHKSFASQARLDAHHEYDHQGIRAICPLCDKTMKSSRLRDHLDMVHNDAAWQWSCNDCGRKFQRKHNLIRHNKTLHTDDGKQPCDFCSKRFWDNGEMMRHRNAVHMGMKMSYNWKRKNEAQKKRTRKLDDGSEVIQQYIDELGNGSQMHKDWQRSNMQGPEQESLLQGGHVQEHGAYVQDRGYLQGQGQEGIGHEPHLTGDEGGSFALDLALGDQLESWM